MAEEVMPDIVKIPDPVFSAPGFSHKYKNKTRTR